MDTLECPFCCETKPLSEFTEMYTCHHRVCTVCLARYCREYVDAHNVNELYWVCPWKDNGDFEPIVDRKAWRKVLDSARVPLLEKILLNVSVPKEDRKVNLMARQNGWRRCPRCCYYVQKIRGCDFIHCRCRKTFCYNCGRGPWLCFCRCRHRIYHLFAAIFDRNYRRAP